MISLLCNRLLRDTHPDVLGVLSLCYPHHPQELVYIVARVADHASKDDQHIVHIKRPHDFVGCALIGRHGFPHLQTVVRNAKLCFNCSRLVCFDMALREKKDPLCILSNYICCGQMLNRQQEEGRKWGKAKGSNLKDKTRRISILLQAKMEKV